MTQRELRALLLALGNKEAMRRNLRQALRSYAVSKRRAGRFSFESWLTDFMVELAR